ncbi:ThiF family adenylyltransferase [Streptomyces sclerotialus]|uniref:ThiF family adenylyltransferase n=1 Tax=Streptomyces sclerotialus TaxID=1957 RepID=UPI00069138E4
MLKPALRQGWRDRSTVRFGVAPAHAVVVGPVDGATGSLLSLIDGTRSIDQLEREAKALQLPPDHARELVGRLDAAGLLDSPAPGAPATEALQADLPAFDRLRPDRAALSVRHRDATSADERLWARSAARVRVRGTGRVGASIAALLSAAGVGDVEVLDGGRVEPWDVLPAGFPADRVGERRDVSARRLVNAHSPWTRRPRTTTRSTWTVRPDRTAPFAQPPPSDPPAVSTRSAPSAQVTDDFSASPGEPALALTVLAPRDGLAAYAPDPRLAEPLLASGIPHLYAGVIEATGVVGPLVLPGDTACAGCWELRRTDTEPAWPRLLAQWRSGRAAPVVPACDAALATTVAGLAATQVLTFLDGYLPPCTGARTELALPCMSWDVDQIEAHPDCACGAARSPATAATSDPRPRHATMTECPRPGPKRVGGTVPA